MKEYLSFRRMMVPAFILFLFWIGVGAIIISSLAYLFTANERLAVTLPTFFVFLIIGLIWWRASCEIAILFFRMNETLTAIHQELERSREGQ